MIRALAVLAAAVLALAPAAAQQAPAPGAGGDLFRSGSSVIVDAPDLGDVFTAGERIDLASPIAGAAHLAGRRIETTAQIGGALYAMGQDIRVDAPVTGAASLAGYDVTILGPIGGNLRAMGRNVALRAPVAGSALIAGDTVELDGAISGDAAVTAETLTFGEAARIDGRLTLYSDATPPLAVPETVIPADRIDRRPLEDRPMMERMTGPGWAALAFGFTAGILLLAALGALIAAVAPQSISRLGGIVKEGPVRALGYGFLTQSALIGGAILLAVTIIGLLLSPFVILAAMLLGLFGYILAVYLFGARIVTHFGGLEADTVAEYCLAAFVGAVAATLLALVPLIGWFVSLALSLTGVGALAIAGLRRRPPV